MRWLGWCSAAVLACAGGGCAAAATDDGGRSDECPTELSDSECARHVRWFQRMDDANCDEDGETVIMIGLIQGADDQALELLLASECGA